MTDIVEVKKELKLWETKFRKDYGRKPNKADIDAAPDNIRETYVKYTKLRKSEPSGKVFNDVDKNVSSLHRPKSPKENVEPKVLFEKGERTDEKNTEMEVGETIIKDTEMCDDASDGIEVWGSQFDRKVVNTDENDSIPKSQTAGGQPSYLEHLGQKMFQQSMKLNKVQKLYPKPNLWRKPDTPRPTKPYRPETETGDGETANIECSNTPQTGMDEVDGSFNSQEDTKPVMFGEVFQKALSISKHKGKADGPGTSSDLYLNKFQTKTKPKQSFLPSNLSNLISKHRKELVIEEEIDETVEFDKADDITDTDDVGYDESGGHSWHVPVSKLIRDDESEFRRNIKRGKKRDKGNDGIKGTRNKVETKRSGETETLIGRGKDKFSENNSVSNSSNVPTVYRNSSHSETEPSGRGNNSSEHAKKQANGIDDNAVSKDGNDEFEFNDGSESDSPVKQKKTRKSTKSISKPRAEKRTKTVESRDGEDSDVEMKESGDDSDKVEEENVKKRKKTVKSQPAAKKRKTNAGSVAVDDEGSVASASVVKKPTRTKPISNDNFVRLNMKVKTYSRKGRQMTGSQYKRKMWKEKMQARSKSYGDACFKCGQSGHWANKCPGGQSKSHYDKEPVQDEDFPSMQEAAMMARGCKGQPSVKKKEVSQDQEKPEETAQPDLGPVEEDVDLEIQSGIVRSRREPVTTPPAMKPLIDCGPGEDIPETPDFVLKGLKKFGFDNFRPGQEEAVMRILCGLSTLVVLSTGGGKSLCYQLPAYLYANRSPCITLVISPLVSLMEDQVTGLPNGIRGVCLHTNMTAHQRENVLEAVKSGQAQFLLVSPEAIAGGSMSLISSMASLPPVAFACIDEAHCLSEWSHNFRPSYLRLCKVLQEKLGVQCFLGLTATATFSTASDVARHLKISDFRKATVRGSPIPPNLILSVSRDENREQALIGLLKGERFGVLDSIIIYCTRRDQTEKVATIIRTCMNTGAPSEMVKKGRAKRPKLEWEAESYHAGLTPAARKRVQNAFMAGRLRVVVATVAFGMGLDKSDVRGVIHYNMPKSFESYVQEIGRAGRDGNRADCHVFLDPEGKDLCELRRHTYANTVDYRTLKKLVQKIFPTCRCKDVHEKHLQAKLEAEMFDEPFDMEECDQSSSIPVDTSNVTDTTAKDNKLGFTENVDETSPSAKNIVKDSEDQTQTATTRLCPGHERALPIQMTVMDLDIKEEGISTLLCYLELHHSQWLENMSNVYANCKIQCYGGPSQLQAVARKCPPVAVAIASARKDGKNFSNINSVEFNVVEVSDTMGWDSGPVKKELKLLQWNFDLGGPRKTGTMVEFSDLAYHFRTPGDFSTDELDDILQFLHERVQRQEKTEIRNLSRLYQALKSVSHRNNWMCSDEPDIDKNDKLKLILNQYFDQQSLTDDGDGDNATIEEEPVPEFSRGQLISDVRGFYNMYGQEHSFNGRAIARIFHGIGSPCFPATTWGRVRRFWRSHLDIEFNTLMKIATKELISFR